MNKPLMSARYLRHRLLPLVTAMLVSGAVGGLAVSWGLSRHGNPASIPAAATTTPTAFLRTAALVAAPAGGPVDFATIAQANGAAVVNISVSGTRRVGLSGDGASRQGARLPHAGGHGHGDLSGDQGFRVLHRSRGRPRGDEAAFRRGCLRRAANYQPTTGQRRTIQSAKGGRL